MCCTFHCLDASASWPRQLHGRSHLARPRSAPWFGPSARSSRRSLGPAPSNGLGSTPRRWSCGSPTTPGRAPSTSKPVQTRVFRCVSEGGLEPPRPCGHQPLKLARLPIPPLRRDCNWNAASRDRSAAPSAYLAAKTITQALPSLRLPDDPASYCPGNDGVVLLVDSGCLTAQSCAYHKRLVLRGIGSTPPIVRLQAKAAGSAYSGRETISSQS